MLEKETECTCKDQHHSLKALAQHPNHTLSSPQEDLASLMPFLASVRFLQPFELLTKRLPTIPSGGLSTYLL